MGFNIAQALDSTHPSFGCQRAVFQFAMTAPDGRVVRFLLVEANNVHAVICMERILMMDGGRVAPNCRIICVLRDCKSVGTRDDLMREVPYVDFMQDIVRPEMLLNDGVTSACFSQSLSREERDYARRKAESLGQEPTALDANPFFAPTLDNNPFIPPARTNMDMEMLESSLCGMGFKKGEVKKFVESLDGASRNKSMSDLLKDGIQFLSA